MLKTELVHHRQYAIRNDAERGIFTYTEGGIITGPSAICYINLVVMELQSRLNRVALVDQDFLEPLPLRPAGSGCRSNKGSHRVSCKPIASQLFASRRVRNQTLTVLRVLTHKNFLIVHLVG